MTRAKTGLMPCNNERCKGSDLPIEFSIKVELVVNLTAGR
jgi:hypothetical protein